MDCHAQPLELWRLLLLFKIYISDYLKFKSKNIRVVVKSLKYSNFLLNTIQEEKQKSKWNSLSPPFFQTVIVSINLHSKNYWNISFVIQNITIRITSLENNFFSKKDSCVTLKRPKIEVPALFLMCSACLH